MESLAQQTKNARHFSIPADIFELPDLDIYAQMVCIVLRSYANGSVRPSLSNITRQGRMNSKQATRALQSLVELDILPHKMFRDIVGDFGDDRLSWAAKGLLLFLHRNPAAGLEEFKELAAQSRDDAASIQAALEELKRYGYLEQLPVESTEQQGT